jgi:hypothetical protein
MNMRGYGTAYSIASGIAKSFFGRNFASARRIYNLLAYSAIVGYIGGQSALSAVSASVMA